MRDDVMTVREVAAYLRVTTKTVYDLARKGELPSFRVGRSVRFLHTEIERFVLAGATSNPGAAQASSLLEQPTQEASR